MSETPQKIEPAPLADNDAPSLDELARRIGSIDVSEELVRKYREQKQRKDSWLSDATEKELYEELLSTLAEVIDGVLPTPINLFVREVWIERIARHLFAWVLKQLINALENA